MRPAVRSTIRWGAHPLQEADLDAECCCRATGDPDRPRPRLPGQRCALWWLEMHPSALCSALVGMVEATENRHRADRSRTTHWLPGDGSGTVCSRPWCGRARLKNATYSRSTRASWHSPRIRTWSRHARRTLPRKRSHTALAHGARTGVRRIAIPLSAATRAQAGPSLRSLSRMSAPGYGRPDSGLRPERFGA